MKSLNFSMTVKVSGKIPSSPEVHYKTYTTKLKLQTLLSSMTCSLVTSSCSDYAAMKLLSHIPPSRHLQVLWQILKASPHLA